MGKERHQDHEDGHHVGHRSLPGSDQLREHPDRQGRLRASGEGGHDDLVERQGKGQHPSRQQRGGHVRQHHVAKRLEAIGAQVHGGLDQGAGGAPEPGQHVVVHDHDAEGRVAQDDGPDAEGDAGHAERAPEADAGDDAGQGDREDQEERWPLAEEAPAPDRGGGERPQDQGDGGGGGRHPEREPERLGMSGRDQATANHCMVRPGGGKTKLLSSALNAYRTMSRRGTWRNRRAATVPRVTRAPRGSAGAAGAGVRGLTEPRRRPAAGRRPDTRS